MAGCNKQAASLFTVHTGTSLEPLEIRFMQPCADHFRTIRCHSSGVFLSQKVGYFSHASRPAPRAETREPGERGSCCAERSKRTLSCVVVVQPLALQSFLAQISTGRYCRRAVDVDSHTLSAARSAESTGSVEPHERSGERKTQSHKSLYYRVGRVAQKAP